MFIWFVLIVQLVTLTVWFSICHLLTCHRLVTFVYKKSPVCTDLFKSYTTTRMWAMPNVMAPCQI